MTCACGKLSRWPCYRCKVPMCEPCQQHGGGWCQQCNEQDARKRRSVPRRKWRRR